VTALIAEREAEQAANQRLLAEVAALAAAVQRLAAPPAAEQHQAYSWLDVAGARNDLDQHLTRLTGWVNRVYLRYPDAAASFPDCWLYHPGIIAQLTWLCDAWRAAMAPGAPLHADGDWHVRQLPHVIGRISAYARHCSLEQHQAGREHAEKPARAYAPPAAIADVARQWATDRDGPPALPRPEFIEERSSSDRRLRPADRAG
jgi:hypothetical protein